MPTLGTVLDLLTPSKAVGTAVGIATGGGGGSTPASGVVGAGTASGLEKVLSWLGLDPTGIVSALAEALLYVVLLLAGIGLVILGISRLTGSHVPPELLEAGAAAAAA